MYIFILLMNVFLIQIVVRGRLGDNGQIFLVLQSPSLAVFVCSEFRWVVTLFNFQIMRKCWSHLPENRPSFRVLKEQLISVAQRLLVD
jgi:hypothetical protein